MMKMEIVKSPNPSILTISMGQMPQCMHDFSRVSVVPNDFARSSEFARFVTAKDGLSLQAVNRFDLMDQNGDFQISLSLKGLQWNGFMGSRATNKVMNVLKDFNKERLINPDIVTSSFSQLGALNAKSLTTIIVTDVLALPEVADKLAQDGGALIVKSVGYDSANNSFSTNLISVGSCAGCTKAKPETLKNIEALIEAAVEGYQAAAPEGHPMRTVKFTGIREEEMTNSFYQLRQEP